MSRHNKKLSIAIPSSVLEDTSNLRDKTVKIGLIARSCAIFGVSQIYVYRCSNSVNDTSLIRTLLEYINLPQYLRRSVYPKSSSLQYAGLLPPLKAPHHKSKVNSSEINIGDFRQGIVLSSDRTLLVDCGLKLPIESEGQSKKGEIVTIKFTSISPTLKAKIINDDDVNYYWGYNVTELSSINNLLTNTNSDLIISTSKKGTPFHNVWHNITNKFQTSERILIIYGSPRRGLLELFNTDNVSIFSDNHLLLNFIPNQNTETIRTEESIQFTLSIINFILHQGIDDLVI